MKTLLLRLGLVLCAIGSTSTQAEQTLNINTSSDVNSPYAMQMIELANQHIGNKYHIKTVDDGVTKSRIMEDVANGTYDVFWASTNNDTEAKFDPIRIPLFKGLLGHRIFIIRQGDQARFDHIKTLEDLKQIKLGSGTTWADTGILKANGLTVVTANKYPNMFYMLDGSRFDAFPRGAHEPFVEIEKNQHLPLTIEKNLMLVYRMPFYLFVRKGNTELVNDLTRGLELALKDGSFDKLFINHPSVQDVIQKAGLQNRRIFYLDNPTLSQAPLDRPELWVDVKTLGKPAQISETAEKAEQ
ncbi:substrate-binding periplasmic protein [Cellvibrio japonicus]|uniref:Uncharacterized protein n=1 Tax=Cellvibrio japonicus (strain Ueda107) TaxID=498211 RepID=B3PIY4_CELJU|nr:transporter substrate-binding domain-containing protein [Cellvibrio japonicus]ACE83323.1 conserved hypothetical protein [Cellvibrio japonicus Ueda107]QEI11193.1 transporter substrate-binding domain-containing protein [Cellvibrio japonicus]QEI14767.1 transporter substrate-binding domain-containing protein [Cellvibrio japonicus]QEI18347.1 transporter substrate-binding domain-containing protein [Cellvibrio japonicus]